jgi:hypothetical protein
MTTATESKESQGFPFATALATLLALFTFLGLGILAYRSPNYLEPPKPVAAGDPTAEPKPDPETRLRELQAKNQAVLDGKPGTDTKMSVAAATHQLLELLKSEKDYLPFPTPEPPPPMVPKTDPKMKK